MRTTSCAGICLLGLLGVVSCADDATVGLEEDTAAEAEMLSLSDGLMAKFTFENANAKDSSSRGHNGTAVGGPSFPLEHGGKALLLDGATQYVTVPHHADLNPTTALTTCAWVKPERLTWPMRILEKGGGGAYWMHLVDSKVYFGISTSNGYSEQLASGIIRVHSWNHVCATYNGSAVSVYIDGQLNTSWAASGSLLGNTDPLTLGWKFNAGDVDHLQGYLDDVRIYKRALASNEVLALYKAGALSTPVELSVKCSVPGTIYLNGHATGATCPATLSLPVAGHYWVGNSSATRGYQQQDVFTDGKSPVAVAFSNSNWQARNKWKVLLFSVRNVDLDNGKKARLSDASIAAALASLKKTAAEWILPFSRNSMEWEISSVVEENTVGQVFIDSNQYPALDPHQILADSGQTDFEAQYDHIFAFYPASYATDGTAYGACCGASTGGVLTQVPDTWGVHFNWTEAAGNSQIWLHEGLHGVEWNQGALYGWPVGINGLHGGADHGYVADPNEAWLPFYRDWMTGTVPENGQMVGMTPMAYLESSPTRRSLFVPNVVVASGKPSALKATAGTAKVSLTWTAASGKPVGYSVKRSTTSGSGFKRIAANITGSSYTDTTAKKGTTYYYVVVSTSPGGESANSAQVSATPK